MGAGQRDEREPVGDQGLNSYRSLDYDISKVLGVPQAPKPSKANRFASDGLEQTLLICFPLSGGQFGSFEEREAVYALEDELDSVAKAAGVGALEGHEFGDGGCVVILNGPSVDELFTAVEHVLRSTPVSTRGMAVKRYGPTKGGRKREITVSW